MPGPLHFKSGDQGNFRKYFYGNVFAQCKACLKCSNKALTLQKVFK